MSQVAPNNTVIRHRGRRAVAAGLLATATLAVMPATQAAAGQDLRSPDTRDAANASGTAKGQDLRSPDSRDAAERSVVSAPEVRTYQDLRSPDARDAAREIASSSPSAPSSDSGGVWTTLGIVAGGILGLMLLGLGARALFSGRQTPAQSAETPLVPR